MDTNGSPGSTASPKDDSDLLSTVSTTEQSNMPEICGFWCKLLDEKTKATTEQPELTSANPRTSNVNSWPFTDYISSFASSEETSFPQHTAKSQPKTPNPRIRPAPYMYVRKGWQQPNVGDDKQSTLAFRTTRPTWGSSYPSRLTVSTPTTPISAPSLYHNLYQRCPGYCNGTYRCCLNYKNRGESSSNRAQPLQLYRNPLKSRKCRQTSSTTWKCVYKVITWGTMMPLPLNRPWSTVSKTWATDFSDTETMSPYGASKYYNSIVDPSSASPRTVTPRYQHWSSSHYNTGLRTESYPQSHLGLGYPYYYYGSQRYNYPLSRLASSNSNSRAYHSIPWRKWRAYYDSDATSPKPAITYSTNSDDTDWPSSRAQTPQPTPTPWWKRTSRSWTPGYDSDVDTQKYLNYYNWPRSSHYMDLSSASAKLAPSGRNIGKFTLARSEFPPSGSYLDYPDPMTKKLTPAYQPPVLGLAMPEPHTKPGIDWEAARKVYVQNMEHGLFFRNYI